MAAVPHLSALFGSLSGDREAARRILESPWAPLLPLGLAALVLAQWVFASFDFHAVYTSTDDSFYYYSWARHLASGAGPTVDGTIPTNGVQPLWALLLAGLAACVRGPEAFVTATLLVCMLLNCAASAVWIRLCHRIGGPWLAWCAGAVLARFLVECRWATLTGMEVSLSLALGSVLVYALVRLRSAGRWHGPWQPVVLGGLLGLFLLARVDNGAYFVLPIALEAGCRVGRRRGLFPYVRARDMVALTLPILILILPYLMWNRLAFGAWLPVSGETKLILTQQARDLRGLPHGWLSNLPRTMSVALRNLSRPLQWTTEWLSKAAWLGTKPQLTAIFFALLTLLVTERAQRRAVGVIIGVSVAAVLPRAIVHAQGLEWGFLDYAVWYLSLEMLAAVLVSAWILRQALLLVPRLGGLGDLSRAALLWLVAGPYLLTALQSYRWEVAHGPDRSRDPLVRVAALRWAETNLPTDAVLGSFNSGLLHYVAVRPVRNLDGRVDDGQFARHLARGGDVLGYARQRGVTHVIDRIYTDSSVFGRFWSDATARGEIVARFPTLDSPGYDIVVLRLPQPESAVP